MNFAMPVMDPCPFCEIANQDLFEPEGLLLYQNNGLHSGQEVPHFHLHVVPRTPGSDWGLGPPHLARVAAGSRAAHLDYRSATDEKTARARAIATAIRG